MLMNKMMMFKKLILTLFFFLTFNISSQTKYIIYFSEKEITSEESLIKHSVLFNQIEKELSPRCIERRKKVLGDDNYINYDDLPVREDFIKELENFGVKIVWRLRWFNAVSCYMDDTIYEKVLDFPFVENIKRVIKFRRKKIFLQNIDRNILLKKTGFKSIFNYGLSLTQMELSDVPVIHKFGITGEGVVIGILDTGFLWEEHETFKDLEIIDEFDFVYNDKDTGNDGDASHGTAVLSLIGGFEEGILISPAFNAGFLLAKTEDIRSETQIEEDNFAAALEWMESKGVDVVNASLGYSEFDSEEESYTYEDMDGKTTIVTRAYEKAFEKGVVVVNSAGNEGNTSWLYITAPSDGKNVLSIGAVDSKNKIAGFSSRGPTFDGRVKPEVVAQGVSNIVASASSSNYYFGGGTSFSGPIVTGIVAQILSLYPHLNNKQIRKTIIESGDNVKNPNNEVGYGLLSARRAIVFPNLIKTSNGYSVNKVFIDTSGNLGRNPELNIKSKNEESFINLEMEYDGHLIYSKEINGYTNGDTILFYFNYSDSANFVKRDPAEGFYKFVYDYLIISKETEIFIDIPEKYFVFQNYPNPFNLFTTIKYSLPEGSIVKVKIYNILGQEIKTLLNEYREAGVYEDLIWDGRNYSGRIVSSGIYFYRIITPKFVKTNKMILNK
ncbi:S8 family peptidase [Bacteroidota bacterium]